MVLQIQASTLAVLMAAQSGKCPYLAGIHDAILLERVEAHKPEPQPINDRSNFNSKDQS